jgi:uncharacterized protein (DUF1330 family)
MRGYLIANIEVTDPVAFAKYRDAVAPMIAAHGGRYLVRGGAVENVEGDLGLKRVVILEYPSFEAAKAFYHGPDYAPLLALRASATISHVALVEGFGG